MADEAEVDAQQTGLAGWTEEVLKPLWYLNPASPRWQEQASAMPEMPAPVWDRLGQALHQEAADRSAGSAVRSITTARRPRRSQWILGSVAAGVALLGLGIVVQSVQSSREVPIVAAGAPEPATLTRLAQAPAAGPQSSSSTPARRVLASGTDYQPLTLRSQVVDLLDSVGARRASDFAGMPSDEQQTTGQSGFTATVPALRACITGLTRSELAQALIVDRARYAGLDAGVVVIPEDFVRALGGIEPTASAKTPSGNVDIWVVEPDCSRMDPGVILHLLHRVSVQ